MTMRNSGLGLVALSAILWGIAGGLGGFLMDKGWDPLIISFYRGAIGLVCLLVWFLFRPTRLTKLLVLWAIVAGMGVAGNFVFYFISIAESSVAVAATLMYTAPIFVLVISFVFRLEKPSLFKFGAIAFVIVGIVLLTEVYSIDSNQVTTLGLAAGLGVGLAYALFIFGFKYASDHGEPQGILMIAFLTFTFIMLFFVDLKDTVSVVSSPDVWWMILLGFFWGGFVFLFICNRVEANVPDLGFDCRHGRTGHGLFVRILHSQSTTQRHPNERHGDHFIDGDRLECEQN